MSLGSDNYTLDKVIKLKEKNERLKNENILLKKINE